MTEREWQSCGRLWELMGFVQHRLSDRKRRLFAVACCRRQGHHLLDPRSRQAVEVAERFALGRATEEERRQAEDDAFDPHVLLRESRLLLDAPVLWSRQAELLTQSAALTVARGIYYAEDAADYARKAVLADEGGWLVEADEERAQCRLLRELLGPSVFRPVAVEPAWRAYNDGAALQLARWIHEARAFDLLPILGDALEEAGCTSADVLDHCRSTPPEEHVRGCWVVDLVLGEE